MTDYLGEMRAIIEAVKPLAKKYRALTGKPLGITGEIGEYIAAKLLGLELEAARQPGYDAIRHRDDKKIQIQIKSRVVNPAKSGGRVGNISLDKPWDTVMLVLLDRDFEPLEIYEADRLSVEQALTAPGSKARNERGQLSISKFKSIAKLV